MKNKPFFYLQYNQINWANQEKTKINYFINNFIINNLILKKKGQNIKIFDMGFGIGFFIKMLYPRLVSSYKVITIEGCEPSKKNFDYLANKKPLQIKQPHSLRLFKNTFLDVKTKTKFDFISSIYVFPHFTYSELARTAKKIYHMLDKNGQFILTLANEKYIANKLKTERDLFIEKNTIYFDKKQYREILHYSDIPKIGKVIDYNREESFYIDLFKKNKFKLKLKKNLNDNGFVCTIFVFVKA